jgi:hypothetical protein
VYERWIRWTGGTEHLCYPHSQLRWESWYRTSWEHFLTNQRFSQLIQLSCTNLWLVRRWTSWTAVPRSGKTTGPGVTNQRFVQASKTPSKVLPAFTNCPVQTLYQLVQLRWRAGKVCKKVLPALHLWWTSWHIVCNSLALPLSYPRRG